ncbi:MAG TPA: transposase [Clostridiales bacterium]|nr:transposase [Clostridiales bacterium]
MNHQTEFICDSIGTVLLHAKVRDGAAKGKIERAFRTIQESWLYGLDITTVKSLEDVNSLLAEFIRSYNLKVHSSTGETPIDRFLKSRERIKTPRSEEWLDECFLHREKRSVRHDATLSINKVQYDVPMQFIGQTVEVRFWPEHMEKAYILYDKKRYPLRKTNKVENGRTKRANLRIDYNLTGGDIHA